MNTLTKSDLKRLCRRPAVLLPCGLALLVGLALFALPIGIKLYLEHWLRENGADTADIQRVRFNPFAGIASLDGVDVKQDGKTVFADSTIYVNAGLLGLFRREVTLDQVTLADIDLDIEQLADGRFRLGSFTLPSGQGAEPEAKKTDGEGASETGKAWLFRVRRVDLSHVAVHYRQSDLAADLLISEGRLERFDTDSAGTAAALFLEGVVNGAPFSLDLPVVRVVPQLEIEGKVAVKDFHLDDLAGLLGEYLKPFAGTAGVDGRVRFALPDAENLEVAFDGHLTLAKGDIAGDGWATAATVDWQGPASFTMTPQEMVVDVNGELQADNAAYSMPDPSMDIRNPSIRISGKTTVTIADEVVVDTGASLVLAPTTYTADFFRTGAGKTTWDGTVRVATGTSTKELSVRVDGALSAVDPRFSLDMDGGDMDVGNRLLNWRGKVEYIMGVGKGSTDYVRTDGKLGGEDITFSLPAIIAIKQKRLAVNGKNEVALGEEIGVAWSGSIDLAETQIEMDGANLDDQQVSWSGEMQYRLGTEDQTISLDGDLRAAGLAAVVDDLALAAHQEDFTSQADFTLRLAEKPEFTGALSAEGKSMNLQIEDAPVATLAALSLSGVQGDGSGGLSINALTLGDIHLPPSRFVPVEVRVPAITLSGAHSADLTGINLERLTIDQSQVTDADNRMLAAVQSASAEQLTVDSTLAAAVERVVLKQGRFLNGDGDKPMVTLEELLAKQISYSPDGGFTCDAVQADALFADLVRRKVEAQAPAAEAEAVAEAKQARPLPIKIGRVVVTGPSGFKFTDATLAKTFMTTFAVDELEVRDIDLNQPDQPFAYTLKGKFEKYTPLQITGKCAPLAAEVFLEQELSLHNYSMLHLSPYSVQAIGTYFPSGQFDLNSSLHIADGRIAMENNLIFTDLETETVNGDLAKELNNQLPVPLGLAVTMLESSDGKIDLDVPVAGEISDLSIGVTDLVLTAMSKAITVSVTPYLAYTALGPAGALTYLGAAIGQKLMQTNLPPLEYERGVSELTDEQRQILDTVGKAIEKDDKGVYTICAKVSVHELATVTADAGENQAVLNNEAIRQELFELGEARSLAVKTFLTSNFPISDERLEICNPGLVFSDTDKPAVEFRK